MKRHSGGIAAAAGAMVGLAACGSISDATGSSDGGAGSATLSIADNELLVRQGQSGSLFLDVTRSDGYRGEVIVRAEGLPEGVSAGEQIVAASASTSAFGLQVEDDAPHSDTEISLCVGSDCVTARLLVAGLPGDLDTSFADGGIFIYNEAPELFLGRAITMAADGGILATGSNSTLATTFKLLPDGSLDPNFGVGGIAQIGAGSYSEGLDIKELDDGRIVMAGVVDSDFGMHSLNADGTPDTGFSEDGIASLETGDDYAELLTFERESSGGFVAVGTRFVPGGAILQGVRFRANGAHDNTFDFSVAQAGAQASAILPDDKLLVCIQIGGLLHVRRYDNGVLDASFGEASGVTAIAAGNGAVCREIIILEDGSILLIGTAGGRVTVAKLTSGGLPDLSFGAGGFVQSALTMESISPNGGAIDSQGRILLAGRYRKDPGTEYQPAIARLLSDGTADWVRVIDTGITGNANGPGAFGIAIDDQDRILASGEIGDAGDQHLLVMRLWP